MPKMGALIGFLLVLIALQSTPLNAELTKIQHLPKKEGNLAILVIGDFGRKGTYNQSEVATQMGVVGEKLNIDYVISTGDNFYEDGLTGVDDPAFYESFSGIYTADSIKTPWYLVLGNHDYRGDVLAQLNPVLQEKDKRFICMRSFILNSGIVDFFMVDTTPFQLDYWTNPGSSHYDWRDVAPRDTYLSNLLQELDEALKKSTAKWKFVVGHHTMRSVSDHGDTPELLQLLLPVLKNYQLTKNSDPKRIPIDFDLCKQVNQVDAYINGHDHCLQHISSNDSKLHYITSGGGSKAWRNVFKKNEDTVRFFYDGQGFMSLEVSETEANFVFYDAFGNVLYKWSIAKATDQLRPSF